MLRNGNDWWGVTLILSLALGVWGCGASAPQLPIMSLTPGSVSLQAGDGTQQFTVVVSNVSDTSVVWKVNGHLNGDATTGTISQKGLYTAPLAVPQGGTVTVEAVSAANPSVQASAVVTLTPPVAIQLTPTTAALQAGQTTQFQATVTNATNTAVTWAVNGVAGGSAATGTVSTAGLYTAPASESGLGQITVSATSVQDPAIQATATVTLQQTATVTISPTSATTDAGGAAIPFTASVTGVSNTAVAWSVNGVAGGNPTVGTVDANGKYTPPATAPSPATVTVTATSAADATKSASAQVTITPPISVTISPLTVTLQPGASQQFTATVTPSANSAVTWTINGKASDPTNGTLTSGGLYTAPATFPGTNTVTIAAVSQADPQRSAQATVTLVQPIAVTITPTTATINLNTTQAFQATVSGGDGSNLNVNWSVNNVAGGDSTLGTIDKNGTFHAPATLPSPATETITATSAADATKSASAQITLQVPPQEFTLSPASSTLSLAKADEGSVTLQLNITSGFTSPVTLAVAGMPVSTTAALDTTSATASGAVKLTVDTSPISLAASAVPLTVTATSTDANGGQLVQTATVLLTITGWAGHVSTLAGGGGGVGYQDGTGTADELYPTAVTSDGGHNLYFADKQGHAIRQFTLANQTVSTVTGGPYSYTIGEGDGIAFNPANNTIYVADSLRNRIVSFTRGDFDVKVVAGADLAGHADGVGAAASFNSPKGIALSPDGSTLYVADTSNELIRQIDLATSTVTTIAGQYHIYNTTNGVGTLATFCQPTGLAMDAAGANLYVSDQCGYDIRQIALPSVTVTTVAGSGAQGQSDGAAMSATFKELSGIAVDPHSGAPVIYIADGNEIRAAHLGANATVYTLAGGAGSGEADGGAGSGTTFYAPDSLTAVADLSGAGTTSLFIADTENGLLRRMDIGNPLTATSQATVTLQTSTLAGQPSHRGFADGVGTGSDYSGVSKALFDQPEGIVTDGKIAYVADSLNGAIRKIDLATSQVSTVAGPGLGWGDGAAGTASFYKNAGLAWVPSQNVIYIAEPGNADIRKLDLSTDQVTTVTGNHNKAGYQDGPLATALFNNPFGILASPDGTKLYIADTGNNLIRMIDLTAGTVSTLAGHGLGNADGIGTAASFAEPNGLAWDPTGQNIYISDFENAAIRELNLATGQVTTVVGMAHTCGGADGPAASATLCDPAFLSTDGRSLFWGDSELGLLRALDLRTMQVYTLAGSSTEQHMADGDFTVDPAHANELGGPVRYNGVFGVALAPDDSFILFTDRQANVVRIVH